MKRPSKFEQGREMVIVEAHSKTINPEPPYCLSFAPGSKVIIQQLEETKSKLSYLARIVRENSYYKLT